MTLPDPVSADPEAQAAGQSDLGDVTPEAPETETPEQQTPQYLTADGLKDTLGRLGYITASEAQSRTDKAVAAAVKQVVRQLGGTPEDRFLATAQKHGITVPEQQRQAFFEDVRRQALLASDAPDEGQSEDANPGQASAGETGGDRMVYWNDFAYQVGLRVGDPELAGLNLGGMTDAQAAQALLAAGQKATARRAAGQAKPVQRKGAPAGAAAVFPTGSAGSKTKDRPTTADAQRDFFGLT